MLYLKNMVSIGFSAEFISDTDNKIVIKVAEIVNDNVVGSFTIGDFQEFVFVNFAACRGDKSMLT